MLPYQMFDETGDWPDDLLALQGGTFPTSLANATVASLPLTAYHNTSLFDPWDGDQEDSDYFVLAGIDEGPHAIFLVGDYCGFYGSVWVESSGGFSIYELNYYTLSSEGNAQQYYLVPLFGNTEHGSDEEALALAKEKGWHDDSIEDVYKYVKVDFIANKPGLFSVDSYTGPDGEEVFKRDYHTGKYVVSVGGTALDVDAMLTEVGVAVPAHPEQVGAGRYMLALDGYEGARDVSWGPGWFEELIPGEDDTGVLSISDLDWSENADGTSTAIGNATIGIKTGNRELLAVKGATYTLTADALNVNGATVSSIVGGKERPLFSGAFSLSLKGANGTISANSDLFKLAGLSTHFSSIKLTTSDVRLTTDLDLADLLLSNFGLSKEVIVITRDGPQFETGVTLDLAKYVGSGNGATPLSLVGKIGVKAKELQLGYNALEDRLYLKGDVSLLDYPAWQGNQGTGSITKPILSLSKAEIGIKDGASYGKGEITSKEFSFGGGWGVSDIKFTFDSEADKYSGSGTLGLPFGKWTGLAGTLEFGLQPEFQMTGLFIEASFISTGIPIFSTGAFLRTLGGGASNLWSDTDPIVWKGAMGFDWMRRVLKLRFEGESDFENKVEGKVKGGILVDDLGLFGSAANPVGAVKFEGSGSLDWTKGIGLYSLDTIDFVNVLNGSCKLTVDSTMGLIIGKGNVNFEVPTTKLKLQGNLFFKFSLDNINERYAAGWATVDNPLYKYVPGAAAKLTIGLRVNIDDDFKFQDDLRVFGANEVPLYSSWSVDQSIADLMVTVAWENAASGPVHTRVVVYDDLAKTKVRETVSEADYAAHGIAVIEPWSGPLGKIVYIAAPAPGLWDVEVVNPEGLGAISYSATTSLQPCSLELDTVNMSGDLVTIDFTAKDPNGDAELLFFADDDSKDYNGILIGRAAEEDGAGKYVWNTTGFASGQYWIYATMQDGQSIPLSDYSTQAVLVIDKSDTSPPKVTSFSPADGANDVAIRSDIVVIFSEAIRLGMGNVVLKTSGGTVVETYDAAIGNRLTVTGKSLKIDPSADLYYGSGYVVELAVGAIKDLAGNNFAGTTTYDFITAARSGPVFTGTPSADTLTGTGGDDTLNGLGGNDLLIPGLGNDAANGDGGDDTVALPMFPNVYTFTPASTHQVDAHYLGHTTVLDSVEFIEFGTAFKTRLPVGDLTSGDIQARLTKLTDLYLAFFGRAPDVTGMEYWQEQHLELGRDFSVISKDFAFSAEAQALYPQTGSNRDFVKTVYLNCFGRDPDPAGWDYWTGRLDALGTTDLNDRGVFVADVLLGAYAPSSGEEDRTLLTNRHDVALYYANQLTLQPEEGFDAAIDDLLARVNTDTGTRDKAEAVIDYVFADATAEVTLTGVMNDPGLLGTIWG